MDQLQIARRGNAPRTREYGSHRVRRRMPKSRWSLRGAYDRFRGRRRNRASRAISGVRG